MDIMKYDDCVSTEGLCTLLLLLRSFSKGVQNGDLMNPDPLPLYDRPMAGDHTERDMSLIDPDVKSQIVKEYNDAFDAAVNKQFRPKDEILQDVQLLIQDVASLIVLDPKMRPEMNRLREDTRAKLTEELEKQLRILVIEEEERVIHGALEKYMEQCDGNPDNSDLVDFVNLAVEAWRRDRYVNMDVYMDYHITQRDLNLYAMSLEQIVAAWSENRCEFDKNRKMLRDAVNEEAARKGAL